METINLIPGVSEALDSRPPHLADLGRDLLRVTRPRLFLTLALPFTMMGAYVLFAWLGYWPLAVVSIMGLSFVTYGSTSHDLVHRTLGLPQRVNDVLLSLIELLSLRSGTAYRLSHLHHHRHLLAHDDVEGATAHGSLLGAIASGPTLQLRLWLWAWNKHKRMRPRLLLEIFGSVGLICLAALAIPWSMGPIIYVVLVIGGSWLFPLITVYIPHNARSTEPLTQTRLFRGRFIQIIAFDHLYHLEHHLYPSVPHHHWKKLAQRLDPYFARAGIKPYHRTGRT